MYIRPLKNYRAFYMIIYISSAHRNNTWNVYFTLFPCLAHPELSDFAEATPPFLSCFQLLSCWSALKHSFFV